MTSPRPPDAARTTDSLGHFNPFGYDLCRTKGAVPRNRYESHRTYRCSSKGSLYGDRRSGGLNEILDAAGDFGRAIRHSDVDHGHSDRATAHLDLGTAAGPLQWVVNGFNVPFALGALLWGAAADRISYRTTFRAGVGLALLGGLLSAASNSLLMLDLSRVMAGLGSAAVLTSATSLLSSLYAGPARNRAFGLFGTAVGLGMAVGPTACWPADSAGARSSWRTARCWWWRR